LAAARCWPFLAIFPAAAAAAAVAADFSFLEAAFLGNAMCGCLLLLLPLPLLLPAAPRLI
jgi:hypothetical protein